MFIYLRMLCYDVCRSAYDKCRQMVRQKIFKLEEMVVSTEENSSNDEQVRMCPDYLTKHLSDSIHDLYAFILMYVQFDMGIGTDALCLLTGGGAV